MEKLLEKLSREKLVAFIAEYAKKDTKFANALNVRFSRPEFNEELYKIEADIDSALSGVSDYRNHDSLGYVYFNVSDIVAEIVQRAEQGYIRLAFAEIELLYRKLLENFEYQGECEISDKAENCLEIMDMIANKAVNEDDKRYIFKQCLALTDIDDGKDYGADYEDKLLRIATKFVTSDNFPELDKALSGFESSKWCGEEFKLIRLDVIRILEGKKAADTFISENLQFPKIREIAFDKAMLHKNFNESEQLCIDALSLYEQHYDISSWLYKLFSVYEMTKNEVKMAETAETILLKGNLEYYDKLKVLLKNHGTWNNSYTELLRKCESKLYYSQYMEILSKEKECELLLEQVKKHPEQVYKYGKLLSKKYSLDIYNMFTGQIRKEAEVAGYREAYKIVCSRIVCFAESGYKVEAAEMINDFKVEYKRRPAFVDELNKIRGVLL